MDPDCTWNYSICKLIDLRVEIDEDWYSVGNIDYDALDDLLVEFSYPFKDERVFVPENE